MIHALDRDGWVRRLPLAGLEESDVRTLVRQSVSTPRDHAALTRRLVAETAGNPFLVTEMLRTPLDAADAPIPVGVQELVVGRLGRLGDTAIDLLGRRRWRGPASSWTWWRPRRGSTRWQRSMRSMLRWGRGWSPRRPPSATGSRTTSCAGPSSPS